MQKKAAGRLSNQRKGASSRGTFSRRRIERKGNKVGGANQTGADITKRSGCCSTREGESEEEAGEGLTKRAPGVGGEPRRPASVVGGEERRTVEKGKRKQEYGVQSLTRKAFLCS